MVIARESEENYVIYVTAWARLVKDMTSSDESESEENYVIYVTDVLKTQVKVKVPSGGPTRPGHQRTTTRVGARPSLQRKLRHLSH